MSHNEVLYSRRMKTADLIAADSGLLSILQRLGIKLGFGDETVADTCQRYGLSTELFLVICNIFSHRNYEPKIESLDENDIKHITNYLRSSHKYYKEVCFPAIHESIHRLVKELDNVSRRLIDKFYDDYDNEVNIHFSYEENVVFHYIDTLFSKGCKQNNGFIIAKFEENHSNIDEKLNDLKNIIMKYLPEDSAPTLRFQILNDIYALDNDLCKHSLIEDKLLIPLVENFENRNE